jgi:hypothetical protein
MTTSASSQTLIEPHFAMLVGCIIPKPTPMNLIVLGVFQGMILGIFLVTD